MNFLDKRVVQIPSATMKRLAALHAWPVLSRARSRCGVDGRVEIV